MSKLQPLKAKVAAFREEVEKTIAFHETWRPMVMDKTLRGRMGRSFATNAFNIIQAALRREMIMGLMRLWDTNSSALRLENIGNILNDGRIVEELARECSRPWEYDHSNAIGMPYQPSTHLERLALERHLANMRDEAIESLREYICEALALIAKYSSGGPGYNFRMELKQHRDQWLAHRQLSPTAAFGPEHKDAAIEGFYNDMVRLVAVLTHVVDHTSYNPNETAAIRRRHAEYFWNGVRGEQTPGHPDYRGPLPPDRP